MAYRFDILFTSIAASNSFERVRDGISKDVEAFTDEPVGWTIVGLTFALPIASLAVLATTRRIAAIGPLAVGLALPTLWALYYATDWFANPGQAVWIPFFS